MTLARRLPLVALLPFISSIMTSCNGPKTFTSEIKMPSESGQSFREIDLKIKHEDMKNHGFEYGDIVELTFTKPNCETKKMIVPYVTNYNEAGTYGPCLCDYEAKGYTLTVATGFQTANIAESDYYADGTCEIKIKQKGGYKKKRELVNVTTKLTYDQCGKDNMKFANCRDVAVVGNIYEHIKYGTLFRGSSPIAESKNKDRYIVADNYLKYHQIDQDISLSLSPDSLYTIYYGKITPEGKVIPAETNVGPYAKALYEDQPITKMYTVSLGSDFFHNERGGKGMMEMYSYIANSNDTEKSFYIHCNEGKDRTGFAIMILEALCGCELQDIVDDYMLTFNNYYNINNIDASTKEKYDCMANLTCYRNIYSFMLAGDDKLKTGTDIYNKLGEIDMLNFDSKTTVEENLKNKESDYLNKCAWKYLNKIGLDDTKIKILQKKFINNI